ncbi:MAG TPA: hypothetical protein VFV27_08180 [Nevskiaceae bacterium]|nr:hypothetical protein [Nevskiaceae bacterium]
MFKPVSRLGLLGAALLLNGCAVSMAARHEGVELEEVLACQTRTCLVARGAEPLTAMAFDEPNIAAFRVRKAKGSTLRAIGHGLLDIGTLGLWELVGTPLEGRLNRAEYYGLKVAFAADGETITSLKVAR